MFTDQVLSTTRVEFYDDIVLNMRYVSIVVVVVVVYLQVLLWIGSRGKGGSALLPYTDYVLLLVIEC